LVKIDKAAKKTAAGSGRRKTLKNLSIKIKREKQKNIGYGTNLW
jgi:hypothetical protein